MYLLIVDTTNKKTFYMSSSDEWIAGYCGVVLTELTDALKRIPAFVVYKPYGTFTVIKTDALWVEVFPIPREKIAETMNME